MARADRTARLRELAIEALTATKRKLEADLAEVDRELKAFAGRATKAGRVAIGIAPVKKRKKRTLAQRKAQAAKMRAYWATKRSGKK